MLAQIKMGSSGVNGCNALATWPIYKGVTNYHISRLTNFPLSKHSYGHYGMHLIKLGNHKRSVFSGLHIGHLTMRDTTIICTYYRKLRMCIKYTN